MAIAIATSRQALADAYKVLGTWIGTTTGTPGTAAGPTNESTGGSPAYARKQTTWTSSTGGVVNGTAVTVDVPASTITHMILCNLVSGSNQVDNSDITDVVFSAQGQAVITPTFTADLTYADAVPDVSDDEVLVGGGFGTLTAIVWPVYIGAALEGPLPPHSCDEPHNGGYQRGTIAWEPVPDSRQLVGRARILLPAGFYTHFVFFTHPSKPQACGVTKMAHPMDLRNPLTYVDIYPIENNSLYLSTMKEIHQ